MNRTIKLLMISDIFVITGFGLIDPILAIFIKEELIGGTIFAAGFASTLFIITKSIIQLPFSRYVDEHDHKIRWLILGMFMIAAVPFIYIFANHINTIYIAQVLYGIGAGFAYPTWLGLWSTHLDKKHESFEWSIYSSATGLGTAITAAAGAVIAEQFGFHVTFLATGAMSIIGCFILFGLQKQEEKKALIRHYHKRRKLVHGKHH